MSCRIVQAFQLHYLFVKRRLPPMQFKIILPIILFPWVAGSTFIHIKKPLNQWCHMRGQWVIPVVCIHSLYLAALVAVTWTIRHIKFRFQELKDIVRGIAVSTVAIGLWIVAYILNEIHEDVSWVQVASRFFLLVMASILILAFFSLSVSQPLLSQISLRHKESDVPTMRQALGIPDNVAAKDPNNSHIDLNIPLEKLLMNKKFRQSFMEFSDSCLAGESVHFYEGAHELAKIPVTDAVKRIYMARHIVEKYIIAGAEMEVNISHRTRQEILGTLDLAVPNLFDKALTELVHLMKTNLVKDYWSSTHYAKLREQLRKETLGFEFRETADSWGFSQRPSSVQCADDPFNQVHIDLGSTSA